VCVCARACACMIIITRGVFFQFEFVYFIHRFQFASCKLPGPAHAHRCDSSREPAPHRCDPSREKTVARCAPPNFLPFSMGSRSSAPSHADTSGGVG